MPAIGDSRPPGTVIEEVRLYQRGTVVAKERAVVVNLVRGACLRVGLRLTSGETVKADAIVTATGLVVKLLGGVALEVDGAPVNVAERFNYKGMMLSDVPNLILFFGYTNASWTLKCDLTCEYVCRLLNFMDAHGYRQCTPRNTDPGVGEAPWIDFTSGYVQRSIAKFPKQGTKAPWRLYQNYALDLLNLRFASVDDGVMRFSSPVVSSPAARSPS